MRWRYIDLIWGIKLHPQKTVRDLHIPRGGYWNCTTTVFHPLFCVIFNFGSFSVSALLFTAHSHSRVVPPHLHSVVFYVSCVRCRFHTKSAVVYPMCLSARKAAVAAAVSGSSAPHRIASRRRRGLGGAQRHNTLQCTIKRWQPRPCPRPPGDTAPCFQTPRQRCSSAFTRRWVLSVPTSVSEPSRVGAAGEVVPERGLWRRTSRLAHAQPFLSPLNPCCVCVCVRVCTCVGDASPRRLPLGRCRQAVRLNHRPRRRPETNLQHPRRPPCRRACRHRRAQPRRRLWSARTWSCGRSHGRRRASKCKVLKCGTTRLTCSGLR